MATARCIELTAEEEQTLRMWTRAGTTEQRLARVVRISPNRESCLRLIRALVVETHEGWPEEAPLPQGGTAG